MSLIELWKIAFANNFNVNQPTKKAVEAFENRIQALEKRVKDLERNSEWGLTM